METARMSFNTESVFNFSEWLREELHYREMTVVKLSKLSGIHANSIHNYLDHRCEPSLFSAHCIFNALGYDLGVMPRDSQ